MKPMREEEFLQSLGAPCSLAETTAFKTTQPALERLLVLVTLKSLATFAFLALASPDSIQPQCTLYDHSDTTLPPITTPEVTLANTDDHWHPSTTETEESDRHNQQLY